MSLCRVAVDVLILLSVRGTAVMEPRVAIRSTFGFTVTKGTLMSFGPTPENL